MKLEVTGRVVGHSIFQPNPKDYPDLELVRIAMTLSPATEDADKHTKAVIVVDKSTSFGDLVLGRIVKITITDHQQDLFLPPASKDKDGSPLKGTITTTDPKTGEQLSADLSDPAGTARVVGSVVNRALGGRSRRGARVN